MRDEPTRYDEAEEERGTAIRARVRQDRDRLTASDHLDRCHKGMAVVSEDLDVLSERLQAILAPDRPTPSLADPRDRGDQSALGDNLDRLADGLDELHRRLRSLLDRVDL